MKKLCETDDFKVYYNRKNYIEYIHTIHELLVQDNDGKFIGWVQFLTDDKEKIVYGFNIAIDSKYKNTLVTKMLIQEFSKLHNKALKPYSYHYEFYNQRFYKLINRQIKYGKLPKELIDNQISEIVHSPSVKIMSAKLFINTLEIQLHNHHFNNLSEINKVYIETNKKLKKIVEAKIENFKEEIPLLTV
ncbi:hypothetical protein [Heyndrickxia oleronia]|jgi:hypothetical protein|uniref:hypothetical protein n=1 Tax=Heyndrickxia oleronia TaxID=38875 RepID=UPI00242DEF72|nr:hypothetical protein [Heyndrickxia oleronia]MCI1590390.1 hypothetical protein [Heyndrickxia oleronia]MCI1611348.1 hypothetical protein [Heyndrickxia oleronia]MCI1742791.1 hypothetical protein [Heyndrickxia oleronia]MCI1763124.1 hypothetical protein [Heyndrickxia oleronia]